MKVKKVIYFFMEEMIYKFILELKDPFLSNIYLIIKQGLIDRQIDVDKVNLNYLSKKSIKKKKIYIIH